MIWPVLAVASIAALVRAGSREPRSIISFGVGADVDTFTREQLDFLNGGRSTHEPERDLFDSEMWMDASTEDPEAIEQFVEEISADDGKYGTTEADLWNRPDLVGDWWTS